MKKAIFLDRDGVINEDTMYPHKIEHFEMLPGVVEGLKKLQKDYIFIIITNQSGIGRGIFTHDDFVTFHNHLISELAKHDIKIEKTHFCPHHPDENCDCRKPNPKSIFDAAKEFDIDLEKSWMIGDHPPDIILGKNAGTKTIFLLTGHGHKHEEEVKPLNPDFIGKNFTEATEFILKNA